MTLALVRQPTRVGLGTMCGDLRPGFEGSRLPRVLLVPAQVYFLARRPSPVTGTPCGVDG